MKSPVAFITLRESKLVRDCNHLEPKELFIDTTSTRVAQVLRVELYNRMDNITLIFTVRQHSMSACVAGAGEQVILQGVLVIEPLRIRVRTVSACTGGYLNAI